MKDADLQALSDRSEAAQNRVPPAQGGAPLCRPASRFAGTFRERSEFDKRSRGTAEVLRGAFLDNKNPRCPGIFSLSEPSDGLEPSTPSLPWRIQPAATRRGKSAWYHAFPAKLLLSLLVSSFLQGP